MRNHNNIFPGYIENVERAGCLKQKAKLRLPISNEFKNASSSQFTLLCICERIC